MAMAETMLTLRQSYRKMNCQQGEDFSLFDQIGFVIIMILLCCGCLHCVPNTLVVLASPHNH